MGHSQRVGPGDSSPGRLFPEPGSQTRNGYIKLENALTNLDTKINNKEAEMHQIKTMTKQGIVRKFRNAIRKSINITKLHQLEEKKINGQDYMLKR